MPNILDDLAVDLYKAADIIGREAVGMIPSVTVNGGSEQVEQGGTVKAHFTREPKVNDNVTPSMTIPEGDAQQVDTKEMSLTKIANVQIPWSGEEMRLVNRSVGYETLYGEQIEQALRTLVNRIELHTNMIAATGSSRAFGTPGTNPFLNDFDAVAEVRQIIFDNGMPVNDQRLSLVINSTAGTKLRNKAQLQKANESGDTRLLRQGTLLDLQGFGLKETLGEYRHTAGTGAGYQVNGALDKGATVITVDTGTGTIVAGDVVTFAGDSNKYVVGEALANGSFTINTPGLREAVADDAAVTVLGAYTANVGLHQGAVELAMRPLAKPKGGDAAVDDLIVSDPHSGLSFRISAYKGYHKGMFDITTLYEAKSWKPDGAALLMG